MYFCLVILCLLFTMILCFLFYVLGWKCCEKRMVNKKYLQDEVWDYMRKNKI